MSTRVVNVVRINDVVQHPNADTLSIATIYDGYPCVIKTGSFSPGDLAVYFPTDVCVPTSDPRFEFLDPKRRGKMHRIKAVRLRGVFSMGLLLPADENMVEGQDVMEHFGAEPYEEPEPRCRRGPSCHSVPGKSAPPPSGLNLLVYDIESVRKYGRVFQPGELVLVEEKIHGCNSFACVWDGKLHVRSRRVWQLLDDGQNSVWAMAARKYELERRLAEIPDHGIFFEIYGPMVQDLRYGVADNDVGIAVFDVLNLKTMSFENVLARDRIICDIGLGFAIPPTYYVGPYTPSEDGSFSNEIRGMAEGKSLVVGADHVREGFVIRPLTERYNRATGRTILKLAGEGYELRK